MSAAHVSDTISAIESAAERWARSHGATLSNSVEWPRLVGRRWAYPMPHNLPGDGLTFLWERCGQYFCCTTIRQGHLSLLILPSMVEFATAYRLRFAIEAWGDCIVVVWTAAAAEPTYPDLF
jgi:hypothetical protein